MFDNFIQFLTQNGIYGIITGALIEPLFMPVPMETLYIPVTLLNPEKAVYYALVLIIFSTLGSSISYAAGRFFGSKILSKFNLVSGTMLDKIENLYNKNSFLTIMTSAFTPVPYEAYTLSAGIFKVNYPRFILAAALSRAIRYLPQSILLKLYGERFASSLRTYGLAAGAVIFAALLLFRWIFKRN